MVVQHPRVEADAVPAPGAAAARFHAQAGLRLEFQVAQRIGGIVLIRELAVRNLRLRGDTA